MKILTNILWFVFILGASLSYYHWYKNYHASLDQWTPYVHKCLSNGGELTSTSTCQFN